MGIHSGPKNGDYASYVELLTRGEPGKVARGNGKNAAWSLQTEVPNVSHGFDSASDPLGSAADIDAACDTRDMPRAEREQPTQRAQQAPSAGALNDMTFGRQPDLPLPRHDAAVPLPRARQTSGARRVPSHPSQHAIASGVQRLVSLFFSLAGVVIIIIGGLTTLMTLLAGSDLSAGLLPALFLVGFGLVLVRISKGLRRQAIQPRGVMPSLTTVSSRPTQQ